MRKTCRRRPTSNSIRGGLRGASFSVSVNRDFPFRLYAKSDPIQAAAFSSSCIRLKSSLKLPLRFPSVSEWTPTTRFCTWPASLGSRAGTYPDPCSFLKKWPHASANGSTTSVPSLSATYCQKHHSGKYFAEMNAPSRRTRRDGRSAMSSTSLIQLPPGRSPRRCPASAAPDRQGAITVRNVN